MLIVSVTVPLRHFSDVSFFGQRARSQSSVTEPAVTIGDGVTRSELEAVTPSVDDILLCCGGRCHTSGVAVSFVTSTNNEFKFTFR